MRVVINGHNMSLEQSTIMNDDSLRTEFFRTPFVCVLLFMLLHWYVVFSFQRGLLLAPSMSGKSTFIKQFIASLGKLLRPEEQFSKIKVFYGVWSQSYMELISLHPNISFHDGPPTVEIDEMLGDNENNTEIDNREPELWSE